MDIYYINIGRRTDRRDFMEGQFHKLGLAATRIEAVTPAELTAEQLDLYCNLSRPKSLGPAELCCGLSHQKVARAILQSGARHAVVLEDDAMLSERLPKFLAAFEANAPADVDLLRIETTFERMRLLQSRVPDLERVGVFHPFSWATGSSAYIASRRAAEAIATTAEFNIKPADQVLFNPFEPLPRQLGLLQVSPGIAAQADRLGRAAAPLGSSISEERGQRMVQRRSGRLWRAWPAAVGNWFHRDIIVGAQKAWHQHVRGARKRDVPFAPT